MSNSGYWGDPEVNLEGVGPGKEVQIPPKQFTEVEEAGIPEKMTVGWIKAQLAPAVWRESRSAVTPQIIQLHHSLAKKGVQKRALMSRIGYSAQNWYQWEKRAREGQQPYLLWYQCVMHAVSGREEMLMDMVTRAAVTDWKAAAWALGKSNPEEFGDIKGNTTVNVHNDSNDTKVTINTVDDAKAQQIANLMQRINALPPAETVMEAEVVEDAE